MKRVFSGRAFGLFEHLRAALLEEGYKDIDIELALDAIVLSAEANVAPSQVSESDPRYPLEVQAYHFFGYVLVCKVDRAERQIRIVNFEKVQE